MQRRILASQQHKDTAVGRSQHQMKKASESKKSTEDNDDPNTPSGSGSAKSTCKEEDVYEFKTTPKDSSSSSGDDKSDNGKSDKSSEKSPRLDRTERPPSGWEKSAGGSSGRDEKTDEHVPKRPYSDVEGDDEDSRRKKRKEGESTCKEPNKGSSSSRSASQRQDKIGKTAGTSTKNPALTNKAVAALERKSPSGSPKPAQAKSTDSDAENDDKGSSDGFGTAGPKVPPLKIVIPQQSTSTDQETGTRNGKNTSARSHAALPYVVASSSNSNDSADKESVSSRCTSPSDSTKSVDEKKNSTTTMTNDEQRQQRVLRSSHRGGQSVDRSNNSSPQLQSSSPSPAPVSSATTAPSTSTTSITAAPSTSSSSSSSSSSSTATTTTTTTTETIDTPSTKPSAALNPTTGGNVGPSSTSPNNTVTNTETEAASNAPSPSASSTSSTKETPQNTVELHPRKRKIRASKDENKQNTINTNPAAQTTSTTDNSDSTATSETPHPHDQPITNTYQMYIYLRSQIERKHRSLFPVQPKPPQGFKDYLLNRQSYLLAGNTSADPVITLPTNMDEKLKTFFASQERERHKLKMQHVVEKEKLVLSVEQEILRVHGRAARALANQSVPFSACTILKDEEVYNIITPEQEEKDRNARSRYNGRLFLSWLQDVDDKWEKIKENMVLRHHNEAESLHAVQKMEWEWKMKELSLCEYKAQPIIEENHVPMVHVSDDFDLLP